MRKTIFEQVSEDVINENSFEETSRRQKAQQALDGRLKNVKTFCIMSAENPKGEALPPEENAKRRNELETYLSNANYPWFRIKGKYINDEKSHMIYNITRSEAERLGKMFNQEGIIFSELDADGAIHYLYLEKGDNGEYQKTHERNEYIDMSNADDFFSRISRKFKFQIPFFDGSDEETAEMMAEHINKINEKVDSKFIDESRLNRYLSNMVNEKKTAKCRWEARGNLFGGWNKE